MMSIRRQVFVLCSIISLVAGCSRGPELAEVEGVVLLDGVPLENAVLEFQPQEQSSGSRPSIGETGPGGRYKLRYSRERTGAIIGRHKVLITTYSPSGDGKFKERIPTIYNSNSTLVREITAPANWLDFDLRSAAVQVSR